MGFWVAFWIAMAFQVVGELLRPKPKLEDAKPSSIGDFNFPTADATRIYGKWWGTCKLQGPNTNWFGDLKSKPISKRIKTGWFSSDTVKQGFEYHLGVQMTFGLGYMDELVDFLIDNKSVLTVAEITADYYEFTMDAPTLLDTGDPKNGVSGPVTVYRGSSTQTGNAYLDSKWNEPGGASGFRDTVYAVLEHCYLGNSDTPPPVAIIGKCVPNPLGLLNGGHDIGGDANIANICYDVMVDDFWGMKIDPLEVDTASFVAAGNTMAAEAFGISLAVETPMTGRQLLAEILRYCDGVIYKDPATGLYTMKLARDDYDVNTIPVFDNSNILPGQFDFDRVSWDETKNTTIVEYIDRADDYNKRPAQYQDPANVFVRGGLIDAETIGFLGVSNNANAIKVAARVNKTRSSPLARMEFKVLPALGRALRPASVIKVVKPDRGFNGVIMRVVDVNYGTLDDPSVTVICTEDIFAINAFAYGPPADSGWVPVWAETLPLEAARLEEVPYEMIDEEVRYVMVLGVRAEFSTQGFEVWSGEIVPNGFVTKTAHAYGTLAGGRLSADYAIGPAEDAAGFTVVDMQDVGLLLDITTVERDQGKNLLLVGDEIMAWQGHTVNADGSVTITGILRGVMDTVPLKHPADSQVYFFNDNVVKTEGMPYPEDLGVMAALPTFSGDYTLPREGLLPVAIVTQSRAMRPNPPGRFRIGGATNYAVGAQNGLVEITWSPRNKTLPGVLSQDAVLSTDDGQAGVVTDITILNADTGALLLHTAEAYASPASFTLAAAANVRVELRSIDFDGQVSLRAQTATFAYTPALGLEVNKLHIIPPPVFNAEGAVELLIVDGVVVVDCRFNDFTLKLDRDATVEFVNVPQDTVVIIQVEQMAPGGHEITFGPEVTSLTGVPYDATPVIGAIDLIGLATTSAGLAWDLKAEQPVPDTYDSYEVDVTPNPAAATVVTDGEIAQSPSVAVTAAVTSEGAATTYALLTWARTDTTGGTDFTITNGTTLNPTFSIPAGTTEVRPTTQQWRVNVQHADGREAHDTVEIALERALAVETVTLQDRSFHDFRVVPRDAKVGFRLGADRNAYRIGGFGGTSAVFAWLENGNAADYKVLATVTSGSVPSGGIGAYVGLEVDQEWTLEATSDTGETKTSVLTITIQDKATSTVQATCEITLTAETTQ